MQINERVGFQFQTGADRGDDRISADARQQAIDIACAGKDLTVDQIQRITNEADIQISVTVSRISGIAYVNVQGNVRARYK